MTSHEAPPCLSGQSPMCAACRCSVETLACGSRGRPCAPKHTISASAQEQGLGRAERGFDCRTCVVGRAEGRDIGIASYVRT